MNIEDYAELLKKKSFQADKIPAPRERGSWSQPAQVSVLEVGCGQGLHPILFAKENPDQHIVACERTVEKFARFQSRLKSHQLPNISAIHEDALSWLVYHQQEVYEFFQKIFFLYPNPYPKNNQRKKRFLAMPAFSVYLNSLAPEGEIIMRTNEFFYMEEAKYLAKEVWSLSLVSEKEIRSGRGITHFERKYLAREEVCFEAIWKKI